MYQFKLEALLNHRRHQEEICQKELAQCRRRLVGEQEKLRLKKNLKREYLLKLQEKQKGSISISNVMLYKNFITRLSEEIEVQTACMREAVKQVNLKRNELIGIVKKRKTLEKLKERDQLVYRKKLALDERKLMDEVATTRYARKA